MSPVMCLNKLTLQFKNTLLPLNGFLVRTDMNDYSTFNAQSFLGRNIINGGMLMLINLE